MLIIEGPDMAGKTMLCKALLKALHDEGGYRKYGPYPAVYEHFSALPRSWSYPKSYLPFIKRYSVMDRFHVSELCYGRICRGRTNLLPNAVRFLDAQLALVGSVTVVITMSEEFLKEQWINNKREEMFTIDQVLRVNEAYMQLGSYHPELRVDLAYHLERAEDMLSTDANAVDTILREWSNRLAFTQSIYGEFYESPAREVNEVRTVCGQLGGLVDVQA